MSESAKNRLRTEKEDLEDKLNKLLEFMTDNPMYGKLGDTQQKLLNVQYYAMNTYHKCLELRLDDINK
jgi:hypothetical protein